MSYKAIGNVDLIYHFANVEYPSTTGITIFPLEPKARNFHCFYFIISTRQCVILEFTELIISCAYYCISLPTSLYVEHYSLSDVMSPKPLDRFKFKCYNIMSMGSSRLVACRSDYKRFSKAID